jgi:glycosyltransferase involved in cell wall biosynthesis
LRWPSVDRWVGSSDLLHVLYPATPVPTSAAVVVTIHDLFPLTHPEWFPTRQRRLFGRAVSWAADRATLIITDSEFTAREISSVLGVGGERLRIIPLGVGNEFFSTPPAGPTERRGVPLGLTPGSYLLAVGVAPERKNLLPVVEAMAEIHSLYPQLLLVAVGPDGPGSDAVRAGVHRLGIEHVVRFTGWVPDFELVPLMAGALALVHPARAEGFGLTPLEAMACGVPCVISDGGALPEVSGEAAMVVDALSPPAWAEAITDLVDDGALRARLVRKGREVAARRRWSETVSRTAAVHLEVLEGR